jgi:hypothetical protein
MNQPRRYDHPLPLEIAMREPQRHWPTVRTSLTFAEYAERVAVSLRPVTAALEQLGVAMQRIGGITRQASETIRRDLLTAWKDV